MGRRSRRRGSPAQPPGPRRHGAPPPTPQPRDQERAAKREPDPDRERPLAVTIAAVAAVVLALGNLIGYLAGLEVGGQRPAPAGLAVSEVVLLTAAIGMWWARYWAVLGFQFILGLMIVYLMLYLIAASTILIALLEVAIAVPAGVLFWALARALPRLQLPERPGSRSQG